MSSFKCASSAFRQGNPPPLYRREPLWLDGQLGEEDDVLQALWEVIIDIKADDGPVDYDACLAALGESSP